MTRYSDSPKMIPPSGPDPKRPRRHALFGWMKGTITIMAGTDLTQPADPDWTNVASSCSVQLGQFGDESL